VKQFDIGGQYWLDEEHGIFILKNFMFDGLDKSDERYLIFDFHRMDIHSLLLRNGKATLTKSPKYGVFIDVVPFKWSTSADCRLPRMTRHNNQAVKVIDALFGLYDTVFGKLFPLNLDMLEALVPVKKCYDGLREYLVFMWYLVQSPQITYLLNDVPTFTNKFVRLSYRNWCANDFVDLKALTPANMVRLPESIYKEVRHLNANYIRHIKSGMQYLDKGHILRALRTLKSKTHVIQLTYLASQEEVTNKFIDRLLSKEDCDKLIPILNRHNSTFVDHCFITHTTFDDLRLNVVALRRIVTEHIRIEEQMRAIRDKAEIDRRKMTLERTVEAYQYLNRTIDGYDFVLLSSEEEFVSEGKKMHNCVAGYSDGKYPIISLRLNDKREVDIQYDPATKRIVQKFQSCNKSCTSQQNKVVSKWLKEIDKEVKNAEENVSR